MVKLPSRQVHLDFHTSEHIAGVGSRFDKKNFQSALMLGRLNSITVFAKCHHSWSYYPTKAGMVHPTLKIDLLGRQIAAAHEIGVRAPIYYTVGWSATDAEMHPEWVARNKDGSMMVPQWDPKGPPAVDLNAGPDEPRPPVSWKFLCPSGGYLELILAQTREICQKYPVDGFFYDICFRECWCKRCRKEIEAHGGDPLNERDAKDQNVRTWHRLMDECNSIIRRHHPQATIYYNGSAGIYSPQWHRHQTHFELEDLPTTWGGYDKFPIRARFFANYGKDYLAMSGKFHTSWGEFGGFKHPDAIKFEAAAMIAYGARCSFGDQMHPCGQMDLATYRNIGLAYGYVEKIEQYGLDGQCVADLGLWLSGSAGGHDQGVANMLLESQIDFNVVGQDSDLSQFKCVILTGDVRLDKASAKKLTDYIAAGGAVLALAGSGLDAAGRKFMIDVGARYLGPARYELDYLLAGKELSRGLVDSPFLNYSPAVRVRPAAGAQVLAAIREPYFNRTYARYCSHLNTPYQLKDAPHPAAVRKGNVVYLAHPLGDIYHKHGARLHRDYFINALRLIYARPVLRAQMPSAGRATLIHQPQHGRYVVHLLYGPPLQRGRCLVIEDLPTIRDVAVEVRLPRKIRRAYLAPQKTPVSFNTKAGAVKLTVPAVQCHQAVVLEY